MEENEKAKLLANLVLSNELILDKIFSFVPTHDLILSINRVNRLWNGGADKMTHFQRKIFINNSNIFAYCEIINNGGVGHRYINLDLNCSEEVPKLSPTQTESILFTFGIIGRYVQELTLKASLWDNDSVKESQSSLFHQLIHQLPNIVELNFRIPGLYGVDPNKLFFSEGPNLSHLENLTLESTEYSDRMKLLVSFLTRSPNLQQINWGSDETISFKIEDFCQLETLSSKFFEKLSLIAFEKLDGELANYLVSKDFKALKKLVVTTGLELPALSRVLAKYSKQLTHLRLALGEVWKNSEYDGIDNWEFPVFQLPVMRNLENLHLSYFGLDSTNPKWPTIKFWECAENFRVFQNFNSFTVFFGAELQQSQIEAILTATFQLSPNNPIFPNVAHINGDFMGDIKAENPHLIDMMTNYFPNVVVYASSQSTPV